MRLPRDINAIELIKLLKIFGYQATRQKESHIRITTIENGEHHITIPNRNPIKLGTLSSIVSEVASHFKLSKEDIANKLF
jgi:predicted RNA binding protein YcfA (HicA-like mRNA interferase family)